MTTKITKYYCPLCAEEAEVIQVDDQHGDIGDEDVTWKRVHLECQGKCPLLWSCVDIPDECYDDSALDKSNRHVDIRTWDNRDMGETWLWIDTVRYVKVNPFDMIENAVENCMDWIVEEEGLTEDEVNKALAVLKQASGR